MFKKWTKTIKPSQPNQKPINKNQSTKQSRPLYPKLQRYPSLNTRQSIGTSLISFMSIITQGIQDKSWAIKYLQSTFSQFSFKSSSSCMNAIQIFHHHFGQPKSSPHQPWTTPAPLTPSAPPPSHKPPHSIYPSSSKIRLCTIYNQPLRRQSMFRSSSRSNNCDLIQHCIWVGFCFVVILVVDFGWWGFK